ncbi:GNAT family N-acetyltransferase [Salisediminibacterium halotolerans]|uniref:Ribosomal protein S18 acetylase RimI n=1 Tax=Salisediminibacterium halotolerans TaxID=517425 RepID=A0A1H9VFA9_9BACI|nr:MULTISPECIES: GNAT family N-acetyltransferase [Salisediminibacterium]RLJ74461.1 ribosomal protein S18 acetylase RimI-like enzyme [Actinophytocola xinjiangensis]RPE87446.1 ribosomal protein S18 acetylase RimI-like enzyme [Salisediminibacterium halotolerans]TWG35297.1 ribosomal protein S18 acetylase RimI-like enzyme [Salisediminibacterium halotolerans]SES20241.1 Ribosomal protein S18 acetylase RimI [Salisediminibacterium haloalkalitolerans]GEL06779.1 hypothetical protein SHA02_01950 [Salisedi
MKIERVKKPADEQTIDQITDLMLEQMMQISVDITRETLKKTVRQALSSESDCEFFISETSSGEIVGAAFLNIGIGLDKGGRYIWLNELYVRKDMRQQGIAKRLLLNLLHWAENEGFQGIELETGISDQATKQLYNSLGFYDIVSKRYGRTL